MRTNSSIERGPLIAKKHTLAKRFSFTISAATSCVSLCLLAPHPIAFYFFPSLIFSHRSRNLRCAATRTRLPCVYTRHVLASARVTMRDTCTRACILRETMGVPASRDGHVSTLKKALGSWRSFISLRLFRGRHWWPYTAQGRSQEGLAASGKGKKNRRSFQPLRIIFRAGSRRCASDYTVQIMRHRNNIAARQYQPFARSTRVPCLGETVVYNSWNECGKLVT